jgi:flagellar motor switch protein FliN
MKNNQDKLLRAANEAELYTWHNFLDLTVQLAVELGRTKLTAEEILELDQNSIIQLARSTGEGVDLLAGGQRFARGEIIMIEDRTGVRINEIIIEEK